MRIFKETQRFSQWWLMALLLITLIITIYSVYQEYLLMKQSDKINFLPLVVTIVIAIATILFIGSVKLTTRIDEKGFTYQLFPFHLKSKHILWSEIQKCYVRKYAPIKEYGGWGLRGIGKRHFLSIGRNGQAYNIKGNIGIQLEFLNGGKLLFGTQQEEKAKQVIKTYSNKLRSNSDFRKS